MKLKRVIRWQNGMVMAFDENGQQIPELQGPFEEVKEKCRAAADADTIFEGGNWTDKRTSREVWT